jgi:hypothetical protein
MAQPKQVIFSTPNNDMCVIDNGAAPVVVTANLNGVLQVTNGQTGLNFDKATLGFDAISPGANSQAINAFGDTGSVLLDTVNDTVYSDPQIGTYPGNPVSATAPIFKTVTTVLTGALLGPRVLWKNPAAILLAFTLGSMLKWM